MSSGKVRGEPGKMTNRVARSVYKVEQWEVVDGGSTTTRS